LKATTQKCSGDSNSFKISKKNYDDLRQNTMVPRVLIVLFLPQREAWIECDLEKVLIYGMGYWVSLKGMQADKNDSNVTIHLPQSQILSSTTLQQWMTAEMKPDDASINFDFEIKWSSEIPADSNIPVKVEIQDHHFSSIMRIGQKLKPQTEVTQNVFIGKVLTLHGEADEHGDMQGEVTLVLLTDEQQTKAKTFFESKFYVVACDAHKRNQYVRISGALSEKPRCFDLKDVSVFEVV